MKKLLFSLLVCTLFVPLLSNADGMVIPPLDYYTWETSQKAAIFYESATKTETMQVSMTFSGNAKDFAWIIPVPNKPNVEKGSQTLFTALETLTGYSYTYDYAMPPYESTAALDKDVTVVEQKAVDYYDVSVLSATDAKALSKWLNDNGYQYPEKYAYIFNDYISNGWYFVAAKIAPDVTDSTAITAQLLSGTATPLQLTFTTENITYPLKISQAVTQNTAASSEAVPNANVNAAVTAPTAMDITLYIIADHRQEVADYSTTYANWIKEENLENLAFDTQGNDWVDAQKSKYFLTKLYKYQQVSAMSEDIFPQDTDKDTIVHSGYEWDSENTMNLIMYSILFTAIGFAVVLLSPLALIFIILSLIFYFAKSAKVKVVCLVLQIIDTIITLCFTAAAIAVTVYSFIELFDALSLSSYLESEINAASIAIACCLTFIALFAGKLVALLIIKKKYKKLKKK